MIKNYKLALMVLLVSCSLSNAMEGEKALQPQSSCKFSELPGGLLGLLKNTDLDLKGRDQAGNGSLHLLFYWLGRVPGYHGNMIKVCDHLQFTNQIIEQELVPLNQKNNTGDTEAHMLAVGFSRLDVNRLKENFELIEKTVSLLREHGTDFRIKNKDWEGRPAAYYIEKLPLKIQQLFSEK